MAASGSGKKGLAGILAEGVKRPPVLTLLVPEDVEVTVVGPDFEAAIAHAVPLVNDFLDFQGPPRRRPRPATVFLMPLRVRALVRERCPRTGRLRRWRKPR